MLVYADIMDARVRKEVSAEDDGDFERINDGDDVVLSKRDRFRWLNMPTGLAIR